MTLEQLRKNLSPEAYEKVTKQLGIKKTSKKSSSVNPTKSVHEPNKVELALFELARSVFGDTVETEQMLVEGRRFRTDVSVKFKEPVVGIKGFAIELDGYRHHGLSITGFKRDREKDRLITLAGYITIRFFASEILKEPLLAKAYLEELRDKYSVQ